MERKDLGRLVTRNIKLHSWIKRVAKEKRRTIPAQIEVFLEGIMELEMVAKNNGAVKNNGHGN